VFSECWLLFASKKLKFLLETRIIMSKTTKLWFNIVGILFLTSYAFGIKCYTCDSSKGMSCNYGLLSFTYESKDCSKGEGGLLDTIASIIPSQCTKLVGVDKDGNEYTARSCIPSTGPVNICDAIAKTIKFAEGKNIEKLDCYTCDTDNCNSASKIAGMGVLGFLTACSLFLY